MNRKFSARIYPALIICLVAGCTSTTPPISPTTAIEPSQTLTPEPTLLPSPTITPTPPPSETDILVDGRPDDWTNYPLNLEDPSGDAQEGFLDLTEAYAFVNKNALYLLVKFVDPAASYSQIQIELKAGDRQLFTFWNPGQREVWIFDITSGSQEFPDVTRSFMAYDTSFEARFDLADIGSPAELTLSSLTVMVGKCCNEPEWHSVDNFQFTQTPIVNEIDSQAANQMNAARNLAQYFNLPAGYLADRLLVPPLPDPGSIAKSQDGTVYVHHWGVSGGISIVNPNTGEATRILDVPWSGAGLVGGPGKSAFVPAYDRIWQIQPDGSLTVWGFNPGTWPKYYTEDGRLLVTVYNDPSSVYELRPDGSLTKVAGGFSGIADIVAAPDGTLFISDNENQTITRINPDGTKLVLARNVVYRDPMDLGFDPSGQLYLNVSSKKLNRVDLDGGGLTTMPVDMMQCTIHPADFVFISDTRVVAVDPTWGTLVWGDVSNGEVGLFVSNEGANTRSSGIGPNDIFYVGVDGCKGNPSGRILAIDPDGNKTIYLNNLPDHIHDMTITSDGGMYIKASNDYSAPSSLYYVPPGGGSANIVQGGNAVGLSQITALPNGNVLGWFHRTNRLLELSPEGPVKDYAFYPPEAIEAFSMSMGPDGFLYGMAELARNRHRGPIVYRQLLQVDLTTGATKVLYENDFRGALAGGAMTAGSDGTLWVLLYPDSEIYRLLPDGTAELFAENLPIDAFTIRTNSIGTVYFTSPGGIYRFHQRP